MEASTAIVQAEQPSALARNDELSVTEIVARVKKVHEVQREVMREGQHYGKIPGVDKPTLLKPGAEILGMVFRLDPQFDVIEQIRDGQHLTVVVKCTLFHISSGARLGSGMGSCSTHESKYAYRKGERTCPQCGTANIIKGKEEYGGGWLCFAKRGGCGAKFGDKDPTIVGQITGRVANEDLADQHNTVLKMAIKRAHVAAILFVTCASEIFTQDVEDMARNDDAGEPQKQQAPQQRQAAQPRNSGARPAQGAPVPSDEELQRALHEISRLPTVESLSAHAKANRGRGWTKSQIAALKSANDERRAQLEDPDYIPDDSVDPDRDGPDPATESN